MFYFSTVVLFVLYKKSPNDIGFSTKYLKQHIVLGLIAGSGVVLTIPLLNVILEVLRLTDHDLLRESTQNDISHNFRILFQKIGIIVLVSFVEQSFFTGIILQSLLKKLNPILAIYIVGLIYTLAAFKLNFGTFMLGICAGLLFKLTGTLYASILLHMSCLLGGVLLENIYPNMITILGFLW